MQQASFQLAKKNLERFWFFGSFFSLFCMAREGDLLDSFLELGGGSLSAKCHECKSMTFSPPPLPALIQFRTPPPRKKNRYGQKIHLAGWLRFLRVCTNVFIPPPPPIRDCRGHNKDIKITDKGTRKGCI